MPKVSDAHRESRRDQIIDAAVACFMRRGIRATTMAEIIAESRLSAGAIYSYFESKQELALAAVRRVAAARAADLEIAAHGEPISPGDMLRVLGEAFAREGAATELIVQMWGEAASDPEFHTIATEAVAEIGGMFVGHLTRWAGAAHGLDADGASAWAKRVLPVVLAIMQGYILQQTVLPGFDRERFIAGVDELFRP